jgi:3-oxoacyl-[acyl-carrier-protein] synthase-3
MPFTGCGAILAQAINLKNPKFILDAHNGGCVSFIFLLDLAHSLMRSYSLSNILICVGQTAAGRGFSGPEVKKKPQAAIPGDGVSVVLVSSSPEAKGLSVGPILFKCHPEYASDMIIIRDDGTSYWQNSLRPMYIDFNEDKLSSIIMRGNRLVPAAMKEVLKMAEIKPSEIDALITNQPNPYFLRNWRESIQLPEEKHFQSFEKYANLFQAGIPVNLDEALRSGRLVEKAKILLAGFSHAGDYSAAALLQA